MVGLTFGILAIAGVFNKKSNYSSPKDSSPKENKKCVKPFIKPKPFSTGYLSRPQKLANLCDSDVMYPINPPYVQYGPYGGNPSKCPVNVFNSIP